MNDYITGVESAIENIRWLVKRESIEIEAPEDTSIGYIKGFLHFIDDSIPYPYALRGIRIKSC